MKIMRKNNKRVKIIIFILTFIILFFIIDNAIRPTVESLAKKEGQSMFTSAINDIVINEMSKSEDYTNLINVQHSESGKVMSITTDSCKVNLLKASISSAVQETLSKKNLKTIYIPIGNLSGIEMLSGKGPGVPINIYTKGTVQTEFNSDFSDAGVNQTKHQIMLNAHANICSVILFCPVYSAAETNILISETVIVGDVPSFYANLS